MRILAILALLIGSATASAAEEAVLKFNQAQKFRVQSESVLVHFKGTASVIGGPNECHFTVTFSETQHSPLDVTVYKDPFELKDWFKLSCDGSKATLQY